MSKADRADLLTTIEEEAGRLSRFVANLLDMTRLESGAINARLDWVDVADAVRGAIARAHDSFPDRRTEVSIPSKLPLIRGDATMLEQVMFNLLDNAHKYGGGPSITRVSVRTEGNQVLVEVSDDGVGIPRDALAKVFQKFYRVEGSDGRAAGTGLGLSICAGFVEAMGGSIAADSPIAGQRGTRITIRLPVSDAQPSTGSSTDRTP